MAVFRIANRLHTGAGCLAALPEEVARLGITRPLLVTDRILASLGAADGIKSRLPGLACGVFAEVSPEPEVAVAEACAAAFRQGGHDGLIAIGGGSAMDIAKVVAVYVGMDGPIEALFEVNSAPPKAFPVIAIPTTAGTGSEVTNIAVLSDKGAQLKRGVVSDHLLADVAFVAPEMSATMPRAVTAASGVDALVHAIEAYLSVRASPLTDALAIHAVKMIARYLPKAYGNPRDLIAREQMATASLMAGMAFGNAGVGAVHALAYPLGGRFNVAHGVSNALLLPYVMAWNKPACRERLRDIAEAMGERVADLSDREAADLAVEAMADLCRAVGIPSGLRAFNIPESAIPGMADDASKIDRLLNNNPRVLSRDDIEAIYRSAF